MNYSNESDEFIFKLFGPSLWCTALLLFLAVVVGAQKPESRRTFLLNSNQLAANKRRIEAANKNLAPALLKLERDAQKMLSSGPFSVTTKEVTPPSGDKHDYMSQAPYFWPDPNSPSGLPYIRRDGERNPEIDEINNHRVLDQVEDVVETLALAYYFKANENYALKATQLMRAFFLDPSTRMNPNLEYAQGIPGISTGRGIGLIETRGLTRRHLRQMTGPFWLYRRFKKSWPGCGTKVAVAVEPCTTGFTPSGIQFQPTGTATIFLNAAKPRLVKWGLTLGRN